MPKQLARESNNSLHCDELRSGRLPREPTRAQQPRDRDAAQTNATHSQPQPQPQPPPHPNHAGRSDAPLDPNGQQTQHCQLSKLVLSNSLHQLAEANFHANNRHLHQLHNEMADERPGSSSSSALNNQNHNHNHINNPLCNQRTQPDTEQNSNSNSNWNPTPNDNDANGDARRHSKTARAPSLEGGHEMDATNVQTRRPDANEPSPRPAAHTGPAHAHSATKREANLNTVHVVVGNESCDLDSAVSCLLMFHIISKMSDELNGKDKTRTLYIPLLNTTRDALDSKCEVLWFLAKTLAIDKSFLTCKDDIDWTEIKRNGVEVLITLVDHNYNDEFKDIGRVVEIIDHHEVQNAEWLLANQAQMRLTLDTSVGSCTTLVAERLFYIYAEHHVSDEILLLIYGTVLLDTICLSEKAKRFTRRDVYLLRKLDQLLGSRRPVRDELYRQLVEVKNSTRELDFERLMKRDLKVYRDKRGMRVGIASLFGMAAKEALGLAANIDLDAFFRQNHYEAFIIMGLIADLHHSDSISRDLVLISAQPALFEKLCQTFEADTSKLDLAPVSGSDSNPNPEDNVINNKRIPDSASMDQGLEAGFVPYYKARIWVQRNVSSSRKVVAPLLLKVLHDGAN